MDPEPQMAAPELFPFLHAGETNVPFLTAERKGEGEGEEHEVLGTATVFVNCPCSLLPVYFGF